MVLANWLFAASFGAGIAYVEVHRGSLTKAGGIAAALVGTIHFGSGLIPTCLLLAFFFTSTALTRVGLTKKRSLHEDDQPSDQRANLPRELRTREDAAKKRRLKAPRGAEQVFANSATACLVCLGITALERGVQLQGPLALDRPAGLRCLYIALLAHYATCCADTWSSEVGMLARGRPVLITTGLPVPHGTNGGVTPLGTCAGVLGGAAMGLAAAAASSLAALLGGAAPPLSDALSHLRAAAFHRCAQMTWTLLQHHSHMRRFVQLHGIRAPGPKPALAPALGGLESWIALALAGAALGLLGTLLDSLLGACLQYSGWDEERKVVVQRPGPAVKHIAGIQALTNNGVNFLSCLLVVMAAAATTRVL